MSLGRVLIVDDEADVRRTIRHILARVGYDVLDAEDGAQAIDLVRSGSPSGSVDVIICDLVMPKVNGMETIAFFRDQIPDVPVIVLTGYPKLDNAIELFQQGVIDYLVKPIVPERILESVEKAVNRGEWPEDRFRS
jgi:DNA-binding NtrC family response regulator